LFWSSERRGNGVLKAKNINSAVLIKMLQRKREMGPSQGKGNGSGNEFPSRKNFLLQLPQTLVKRERKKAKASAVTVIIIKCMRCHQGCKGPFLPLFLYKNKKKGKREKGRKQGRKRESATTLVVITRASLGSMAAVMFI